MAIHDKGIARLCGPSSYTLVNEGDFGVDIPEAATYDTDEYLEAWNRPEPMEMDIASAHPLEYSPSRSHGSATNANLA